MSISNFGLQRSRRENAVTLSAFRSAVRKSVKGGVPFGAREVGHGTDNFPCSGNLELSPCPGAKNGQDTLGKGRRNVQEQKIRRKGRALTWNTEQH